MILLVILEIIVLTVTGVLLTVSVKENIKRRKAILENSILLQADINNDMDEFGFNNQGNSLNDVTIFEVSYDAIGYLED